MGLIAFTERSRDDNLPFKKNEFHVGKHSRNEVLSKPVQNADAISAATRSTIRREPRQSRRRRTARLGTMVDRNAPISSAGRRPPPSLSRSITEHLAEEDRVAEYHAEFSDQVEARRRDRTSRDEPITYFSPASRYYEEAAERIANQQRDVARTIMNRPMSSGAATPGRVASPATEQAILRDIANPDDRENDYRLFVDGASEEADSTQEDPSQSGSHPEREGISRSVYDVGSDAEENWTSLMETIPAQDEDQPSASSSFASDTASSILSRSRPHSSLTNTTAASVIIDAAASRDSGSNCPELDALARVSTLAPVTYSSQPRSERRSAIYQESVNDVANSAGSSRRLDVLDDLMDMLNNGIDVPAEMWAAVGVSPHLGLRGGAGRLRRSERL